MIFVVKLPHHDSVVVFRLRGYDMPLDQALNEQAKLSAAKAMVSSADFVEGPKAFAEKRKPIWSGR